MHMSFLFLILLSFAHEEREGSHNQTQSDKYTGFPPLPTSWKNKLPTWTMHQNEILSLIHIRQSKKRMDTQNNCLKSL